MDRTRRAAMAAGLGLFFLAVWPAQAFDIACGMVCSDTSAGSACMSACEANNRAQSGGQAVAQRYAAIALSPTTLQYGYSYRFASRRQAEEAALTYCHATPGKPRDCKVVVWAHNTCVSLALKPPNAQGKAGAWGAQWAPARDAARKKALALCQSVAPSGCKTELVVCAAS